MKRREAIKQLGLATAAMVSTLLCIQLKQRKINLSMTNFDVIIIGGSYSGLSAAMALGRSLRKVLILDSGLPCNRQTPHSHNFITQDGKTPKEISEAAKRQVLEYETVHFLEELAIAGEKDASGFKIQTQSGKEFLAKKVVFATGIKDLMPNIKGFSDCWGISVVHCPYCHGYEIRHKKTGILANGEHAYHLAPMVKNLTSDVTILTSGKANFNSEQIKKMRDNNIKIIEKEIVEIEHLNGYIKNVVFADNSKEHFEATYAAIPFKQHSSIPESLGCAINDMGYLEVDMMQKTTIEGVFACGDNCSRLRSVANAVAAGNKVGAVVNMELSFENF
ncbi:NAD(P)/FAD-dependent oxidoreductase [Seonamhaeicola marinus]|uniref:NAD(P)/FAD-dependent oxidoreductase n=1 Tax=Seonamhaeicola marinus TaxID=1912246 RepID=A0A5D0I8C7_9FLAO|nr:NAD(P)/FAD-dependent oxidoreductase [Seonamhaeicola marinus]TYA78687.1 NAD(P)/FAD-dependent oxidoreductase [Seonamhaeicola marinus]